MKRTSAQALPIGGTNAPASPPVKRRKKSGPELVHDGVPLATFASDESITAPNRLGSGNPFTAVATYGRDAGSTSLEGASTELRELLEAMVQADPAARDLLQRIPDAEDRRIGDTTKLSEDFALATWQDALHQRQLGYQGEHWVSTYAPQYRLGSLEDYSVDGKVHRIEVALERCGHLPSQATVRWAFLHGLKMMAFERICGNEGRGITLFLAFAPQQFSNLPPHEFKSLLHCLKEPQNSWMLNFASEMSSFVGDTQRTYDKQSWFELFDGAGRAQIQPPYMGTRSVMNAFLHVTPSIFANGGQILGAYTTPPSDPGHIYAGQDLGRSTPPQSPIYVNAGQNSGYLTTLQAPRYVNDGQDLGHLMTPQASGQVYDSQNLEYLTRPQAPGQGYGGQCGKWPMTPQAPGQGYNDRELGHSMTPQATGQVHAGQNMGSSTTLQASGQGCGGQGLEYPTAPEAPGQGHRGKDWKYSRPPQATGNLQGFQNLAEYLMAPKAIRNVQAQLPHLDMNAFGSTTSSDFTDAGQNLTDLTASPAAGDVDGGYLMTPQASNNSSQDQGSQTTQETTPHQDTARRTTTPQTPEFDDDQWADILKEAVSEYGQQMDDAFLARLFLTD